VDSRDIVVACNSSSDAEVDVALLKHEFDEVAVAADPDRAADDFESLRPHVLVLAFGSLEHAERYCLGLYRRSTLAQAWPHRTVVLCHKDEVRRAYELCKKGYFDDYVLFWPFNHDAPRLAMAVRHALREMAFASATPAGKLAAETRHLTKLQNALATRAAEGRSHIDSAGASIDKAHDEIRAALGALADELTTRLAGAVPDPAERRTLINAVHQVEASRVEPQLQRISAAMKPLGKWNANLASDIAPALSSLQALRDLAGQEKPLVLVVDDDEFQRRTVATLLAAEPLQIATAATGSDMATVLRHQVPCLVLMDVNLPDVNGVEATRQLKSMHRYADTSVIMMTGRSERQVVTDSIAAGAVGFIVKPVDKATLIEKVRRHAGLA